MNTPSYNQPTLLNLVTQTVSVLSDTTIIGRHEDCNLVLNAERGASRKHARITVENNVAILMDLGSLNGTMVNGREISRAIQLVDGDIVIFDEQEYRFSAAQSEEQNSGENVTVIANKDEIGHPDRITSAIRVVEPTIASTEQEAVSTSFDETESWDIPAATDGIVPPPDQLQQNQTRANIDQANANQSEDEAQRLDEHYSDHRHVAIPATSRPGGDAPTPKRIKDRQPSAQVEQSAKPFWSRWFVLLPLLILFMLIAFYFAYTAGFSAGNATVASESS